MFRSNMYGAAHQPAKVQVPARAKAHATELREMIARWHLEAVDLAEREDCSAYVGALASAMASLDALAGGFEMIARDQLSPS